MVEVKDGPIPAGRSGDSILIVVIPSTAAIKDSITILNHPFMISHIEAESKTEENHIVENESALSKST